MAMRTRRNTLFMGARSVQLRDGSKLNPEIDPRTLRTIIHQQLHTHKNRFVNKAEESRKSQAVARVQSRGKAVNPSTKPVKNNPPPPKQLPLAVVKKEESFKDMIKGDKEVIHYH